MFSPSTPLLSLRSAASPTRCFTHGWCITPLPRPPPSPGLLHHSAAGCDSDQPAAIRSPLRHGAAAASALHEGSPQEHPSRADRHQQSKHSSTPQAPRTARPEVPNRRQTPEAEPVPAWASASLGQRMTWTQNRPESLSESSILCCSRAVDASLYHRSLFPR